MKLPDVTPIQWGVIVAAVANLLRAFGVYDLNPEQVSALEQVLAVATALGLFDAIIRHGRSRALRPVAIERRHDE